MNVRKFRFGISGRYLNKILYITMIIAVCLIITSEYADAKEPDSTFLRISSDAKGAAMAGAQGAMTGDVYAMHWNPAGLSNVLLNEFGASYQMAFQGINYSYLGYATLTNKMGAVGGQVFFLSSGGITSTYENPDGSFAGTGDSFSVADLGIGFTQAKSLTNSLAYGISVKILSHKVMDQHAFSLAGDFGMIYQTLAKPLKIGAAVQNFSTEYRFINEYLREPWNIRLSALYSFENSPLVLASDYNMLLDGSDTLSIGTEYRILDLIAFRAGVLLPPPDGLVSGLSGGLGINLFDLYQLDYAVSLHSALGVNQRFSLVLRF